MYPHKNRASFLQRFTSIVCVVAILFTSFFAAAAQKPVSNSQAVAAPQNDPTLDKQTAPCLELGQTVEVGTQGRKTHYYQIAMQAGQYAQILFYHDSNISAEIIAPDGYRAKDSFTEGGAGGTSKLFSGETVFIAEVTGNYFLEAEAGQSNLRYYQFKLNVLRNATAEDRKRVAAYKEFSRVVGLHQERKAASYLKATEVGIEAVRLWQELGDLQMAARTLYYMGESYESISRYAEALDYFNRALNAARATDDDWIQPDILISMGQTYQYLSEYQKALDHYNQGLKFCLSENDRTHSVRAWALNNKGVAYSSLGEKQKALSFHQQAYKLYQDIERRGEAHALTHMADVFASQGEKQKALEYLERALPLWAVARDIWGRARVYHRMGNVYLSLGDTQEAIKNYTQALALWQETGDKDAEADTLNNLGIVYSSMGDYQKSLEYLNQSLAVRESNGQNNSKREGKAHTFTQMGATYYSLGNRQSAIDYYTQALQIWREIGNPNGEGYTLNYLADAYYAMGDGEKAFDFYQQSLAIQRSLFDREGEAYTLYGIARLERDQGKFNDARARIEAAIKLVEDVRMSVASQELRASYLAKVQDYYELYIDLLMRLDRLDTEGGYAAMALHASERARARSLLEMLAESEADIREGISPALLKQARDLRQKVSDKAEYQTRLLIRKHSFEESKLAHNEVDAASKEYEQVLIKIQTSNSRYASLTQPKPLTVTEIQKQLLDKNTLLLEYALGKDRSFLWAVSPTSIKSYELPNREEIENAAKQLYNLWTESSKVVKDETAAQKRERLAKAESEWGAAANALSKMLLAPVANQLGKKRLLIVADGALQYIPFNALPDPNGEGKRQKAKRKTDPNLSAILKPYSAIRNPQSAIEYQPLMVEHETISLPSASVLAVLRKEARGRKPASKSVAVFADPVFSNDDERVLAMAEKRGYKIEPPPAVEPDKALHDLQRAIEDIDELEQGHKIQRLFATRFEAEKIASLASPKKRFKALDFAANRETAMSAKLKNYRIIHFASHALLNTKNPELSGIVLSLVDEKGRQRDGFLRAHEVYNMKLPVELVVLSACRTGLGKEVRGEGLIGLTRGFMYAGATRVIASLWSVDDKTSAELMTRVYQLMLKRKAMSPASALRAAQIEMWQSQRYPSPYYWAGFILQGEWR